MANADTEIVEAYGAASEKYTQRLFWPLAGIFWIMLFAALKVGQSFIVPILLALVISLIFSPIRRSLGRLGVSNVAVAGLAIGGIAIVVSMIVILLGSSIQGKLKSAPDLIPRAAEKIESLLGAVDPLQSMGVELPAPDPEAQASSDMQEVTIREPSLLQQIAKTAPGIIGQLLFILIFAFALIASGDMFYEKLVQVIPTIKDKQRVILAARDIERSVSSYLLTITITNALLALTVGVAMWLLKMPDAIILALLAFFLNYIPYLGSIALEAIAFVVALLHFDQAWMAVIPPLVIWVLTMIEGQIVTPLMIGRRLQLNAVAVFISLALWGWLWGIAGMLLAMPVLIATKRICESVAGWQSFGIFLGPREEAHAADRLILKWTLRPDRKKPAPAAPTSE